MAKTWYPVIDYIACIECGICSGFCTHGVYDKSKSPSPLIANPNNCIDHCHGCGNKCPVGAITYVGEDTEWIPPVLRNDDKVDKKPSSDCGCGCGGK